MNRTGAIHTILRVEGERDRPATVALLHEAVRRMRPEGPSFVILSRHPDNGDYAQTGGGGGEYAVEWRESGEPFRHLVAGKGNPATAWHRVRMNGGYTRVLRHEVLSANDVCAILGAFLMDLGLPKNYLWRDVTDEHLPDCDPDGKSPQ